MIIKVGDVVPLSAQAHDGNEGLKVITVIYDDAQKRLGDVLLTHVANGLYESSLFKMPDVPFIFAQYLTDAPDDYARAIDVFKSIPKDLVKENIVKGEIIARERVSGIVLGVAKREN